MRRIVLIDGESLSRGIHNLAFVEFMEVKKYHWQNELEGAKEIKLIVTTAADNFAKVESIVKKSHSYKTPVLRPVPTTARIAGNAAAWLADGVVDE